MSEESGQTGLEKLMDDARKRYATGVRPIQGTLWSLEEETLCCCAVGAALLDDRETLGMAWPMAAAAKYGLDRTEILAFADGFDQESVPPETWKEREAWRMGKAFAKEVGL